jgi:hypothetical protein
VKRNFKILEKQSNIFPSPLHDSLEDSLEEWGDDMFVKEVSEIVGEWNSNEIEGIPLYEFREKFRESGWEFYNTWKRPYMMEEVGRIVVISQDLEQYLEDPNELDWSDVTEYKTTLTEV